MPLASSTIRRVTPERLPSQLTAWERNTAELLESRLETTLVHSFLWAQVLTRAFNSGAIGLELPPVTLFSSGFVKVTRDFYQDIAKRCAVDDGYVFGAQVVSRELEGSRVPGVMYVSVDGIDLPIILCAGGIELHGKPPNPSQRGSTWQATCWAKNNQTSSGWRDGILTCRHGFTSLIKGAKVSLTPSSSHSSPNQATLVDFDSCTIDGAIVDASSWPRNIASLTCQQATAPGQTVEFHTASGKATASVLRTYLMPSYVGNLFGQRVITDLSGTPGDSGTILQDSSTSEGVGIYMGTVPNGAGGTEGIFQSLYQVESYFKLLLYL